MSVVRLRVIGDPAPQGSKRAFVAGDRAVMKESSAPKLRSWRQDVAAVAAEHLATGGAQLTGPLRLQATFIFARPASHFGTGRNAGVVKASAPTWVTETNRGDVDKLLRSTFDALTASALIVDDRFIVRVSTSKRYAQPGEASGAHLVLGGAA